MFEALKLQKISVMLFTKNQLFGSCAGSDLQAICISPNTEMDTIFCACTLMQIQNIFESNVHSALWLNT